jgi:hypothetical protein
MPITRNSGCFSLPKVRRLKPWNRLVGLRTALMLIISLPEHMGIWGKAGTLGSNRVLMVLNMQ